MTLVLCSYYDGKIMICRQQQQQQQHTFAMVRPSRIRGPV